MSIYATLWEIQVRQRHGFDHRWVRVYAQAVPAHIGHPSEYPEGDPYAGFLPPVVKEYDPAMGAAPFHRAVVIVQEGRNAKDGQRFIDPLIVLTGEEYARIPFQELLDRIHKAVGWDDSIVAQYIAPDGRKRLLRDTNPSEDQEPEAPLNESDDETKPPEA